jgi:hypothetical protein
MLREKYLANIDRLLESVVRKESDNIKDKNKIPYTEDMEKKGSVKKIAFDIYHVENDPYNSLWMVEDIDGKNFLVRTADPKYDTIENGSWTATSNYDKNNITLAYKSYPISSFSSETYGFNSEDIIAFKKALLESVNNDQSFVRDVLMEQPEAKRQALSSSFPELNKIIRG